VRIEHLRVEPACIVCGTRVHVEVHHVEAFHAKPELELEPSNLVTLCRRDHFVFGHLLDFRAWDPDVRAHVKIYRGWVEHRKELIK